MNKRQIFGLATVLGLALVTGGQTVSAQEKGAELKVGDKAPTFTSVDDQGKPWKSKDHVGKGYVVVYFYPADMTGGCTKQACSFRDDFKQLRDLGVEIIGVSGDSVKNHQIFKKEYDLNFTLLADEKGEVAKSFGVPTKAGATIKKEIGGVEVELTRGVTASRWTFLVDPKGNIAYVNTKVDPAQDSKNIMKVIQDKGA